MANRNMQFKQEFMREFREDPQNSLKKYGIEMKPNELEMFNKEEVKSMTDEQLFDRFSKSRFMSMFDFF